MKDRFDTIEKNLLKYPWFKKDKWLTSVHYFPNEKKPDGVTLQVFKKHWWNEDRQGVHIESYLDLDPKKQKKTYVTLHLLHSPVIPNTKIKRLQLSKIFVDQIFSEVKKWPGYKFRVGKYGTQPFTKYLDATAPEFEKHLETEICRICTKLGPVLEDCISQVLENNKKTAKVK